MSVGKYVVQCKGHAGILYVRAAARPGGRLQALSHNQLSH